MLEKIKQLGQWISTFPYENLTKRLHGTPRAPGQILGERDQVGAGGTCFSLVNLAETKARQNGLSPRFYLGNRPDGENRHCVLGFPDTGVFLDPGYLCFEPLPLNPITEFTRVRPHNILHLQPDEKQRIKISTERKDQLTWRYTLKVTPVSRDTFERCWKNSFEWDGVMTSTVMTRLNSNGMLCYMNGRLESITLEERRTLEIPEEQDNKVYLADLFDVQPELIERWNHESSTTPND